MLGLDPWHSWRADVVEARHLGSGFAARDDAFGNFFAFSGVEFLLLPDSRRSVV
jgi:hypothetical protein